MIYPFAVHRNLWYDHAIYVIRSTVIPEMNFCHGDFTQSTCMLGMIILQVIIITKSFYPFYVSMYVCTVY